MFYIEPAVEAYINAKQLMVPFDVWKELLALVYAWKLLCKVTYFICEQIQEPHSGRIQDFRN